jgi:hypothetical protein
MIAASPPAPSAPARQAANAIALTDFGLLFIAVTASVVIAILAGELVGVFTPFRVAALAALVAFLLLRALGARLVIADARLSWWLFGAVIAGLFVAGSIAPHYMGGQDQGYYTAIAEMLARGEPINFHDRFRGSLPEDLRQIYDAQGVWDIAALPTGKQVVHFYSLHPALMALATQLIGKGYHTVLLLLCFVVNIVVVYLLTFELSGGRRGAAGLASWLVALNPAYVFFAKFPVTEITAAAMLAPSFYFLLLGYRARNLRLMALYGIAALLFMNAFCFTRMSFPEIAPFLLVLAAVLFFLPEVTPRQKVFVLLFVAGAFACFALSGLYYRAMIPALFRGIVSGTYLPALNRAKWLIAAGAVSGLAILAALAWPVTRARMHAFVIACIRIVERTIVAAPGFVILLVALPSIVLLVRSGTLDAFEYRPQGLRPGLQMIRFSAVYVLMAFMSPFLFVLLFAGMKTRPDCGRARLLPGLFLAAVWPVYMTFASSVPYLYYFGRYLVPSVLPAAIIVAVLALDTGRLPRLAARMLAALALIWSAAFSLAQLPHREGEVGRPFHQIADHLHPGDVLVIDGAQFVEGSRSQFVIPLRYALGISTFIIPPGSVEERLSVFERLRAVTSGRMYFLSLQNAAAAGDLQRAGFEVIDRIPFDLSWQRVDQDPMRLDAWLLPHRTMRFRVYDLILHRVPARFATAAAPAQ